MEQNLFITSTLFTIVEELLRMEAKMEREGGGGGGVIETGERARARARETGIEWEIISFREE